MMGVFSNNLLDERSAQSCRSSRSSPRGAGWLSGGLYRSLDIA